MKHQTNTIVRIVSEHFHVPVNLVKGKIKLAPVVEARHVSAWVITDVLKLSTSQTAKVLGYNDHGSTIHALKSIRNRKEMEPHFRARLEKITALAKFHCKGEPLGVEHVNVLAGCNIAGRIRVAMDAIKNPARAHRPALDELKELLKFVSNPQPKLKVLMEIKGGCGYITSCPDCVEATIIDHD